LDKYKIHSDMHLCFDQEADVVLFDGAAIERGTVVDVLYHHHVQESGDGRQGSGKVWHPRQFQLKQ